MNHTAIKWIGTVVIVGIGIFFAFYLSNNWKIEEYKGYKLSLKGHVFELEDAKSLKVDIRLVFSDKKDAQAVSDKQNELNYDLNSFMKELPSSRFMDQDNIESVKYELTSKLKNKGYKIEFLTFDSTPVVFEY